LGEVGFVKGFYLLKREELSAVLVKACLY